MLATFTKSTESVAVPASGLYMTCYNYDVSFDTSEFLNLGGRWARSAGVGSSITTHAGKPPTLYDSALATNVTVLQRGVMIGDDFAKQSEDQVSGTAGNYYLAAEDYFGAHHIDMSGVSLTGWGDVSRSAFLSKCVCSFIRTTGAGGAGAWPNAVAMLDRNRPSACLEYAVPIDPASDVPAFYTKPATHCLIAWSTGTSYGKYGLHIASSSDPVAGWHVVPNDQNFIGSSRYINGIECMPVMSGGLPIGFASQEPAIYWSSDPSSHCSATMTQWGTPATLSGINSSVTFPTCWDPPTVNIVSLIESLDIDIAHGSGTDYSMAVLAQCYPGNQTVTLATIPIDYTATGYGTVFWTRQLNVTLNWSLIPAECTGVRLTLDRGDIPYLSYALLCFGIWVDAIPPDNPKQTTHWPDCVPGFARRMALP